MSALVDPGKYGSLLAVSLTDDIVPQIFSIRIHAALETATPHIKVPEDLCDEHLMMSAYSVANDHTIFYSGGTQAPLS